MHDERPKDIPELRGMAREREGRDPARKYSPASYAAQYGVTVEDAQELCAKLQTHQDVVGACVRIATADKDRFQAIIVGEERRYDGGKWHPEEAGEEIR